MVNLPKNLGEQIQKDSLYPKGTLIGEIFLNSSIFYMDPGDIVNYLNKVRAEQMKNIK